MQREIDRVRTSFIAANPGFELYVNSQVRSLDTQIEHWNINESVEAAAEDILVAAQALIASPGFSADRPEQARETLEAFLYQHAPVPKPTIAAPGLSLHGQMRAIDFQVHQGGRVVAGPNTATIATDWVAAGWTAKLHTAVRDTSNKFVGPQASPPEPWHYTYVPGSAGPRLGSGGGGRASCYWASLLSRVLASLHREIGGAVDFVELAGVKLCGIEPALETFLKARGGRRRERT